MCACAHFVCLPPFLPANFKEQAGRSQGFHNHVFDPRDRELPKYCHCCETIRTHSCSVVNGLGLLI
jgi:hypothetical protein